MLSLSYNFKFAQSIQVGLVTIADIFEQNPSLVCATVGGKVFYHTPHEKSRDEKNADITFININKNIIGLTSGKLDPARPNDILILSSQNNLIAYDVSNNSDLFYKDVSDGISCLHFGICNNKALVYIGGNCAIQGFDKTGEECYWNVSGDNVSTISLIKLEDEDTMLIVGSDDNSIRFYKGEEIFLEINEASKPICLIGLYADKFAFALENGSVGVYQKKNRLWRVKSKVKAVSLISIDPQKDGFSGVLIGWESGRLEIRSDISGETLFKLMLNAPIAKLMKYDYRKDGYEQIICVTTDGTVRGYTLQNQQNENLGVSNIEKLNDIYNDLLKKKNDLSIEYNAVCDNRKASQKPNFNDQSIIPSNTKLSGEFRHNHQKRYAELLLSTTNSSIIKAVVIFAEKIFQNESFVWAPESPSSRIYVPLLTHMNVSVDLNIKVLVGLSVNSTQFQTFEMIVRMPKFVRFMYVSGFDALGVQPPSSCVYFTLKERIPRFTKWIEQCFIVDENSLAALEKNESLEMSFIDLASYQPLQILIYSSENGKCTIKTNNMETAGDIIQDLVSFMNLKDLESIADFPEEIENFKKIIKEVEDYDAARLHITGDIADAVGNVKTFIVKAEDSRLLSDMKNLKKMYSNIMIENRNLVAELLKRSSNQEGLIKILKEVNKMINKAGNLRAGQSKQKVITLCRNSLKINNFFSMIQVMLNGKEGN